MEIEGACNTMQVEAEERADGGKGGKEGRENENKQVVRQRGVKEQRSRWAAEDEGAA